MLQGPSSNIFFDREGSIEAGRKLCNVKEGDEIVISGIAGVYPDSGELDKITVFKVWKRVMNSK